MPEMRAYLVEQKVWYIVSGKDTRHEDAAQAIVWRDKYAAAAGAIYRALEPGQRVHAVGVEMDPVKMWEKLAAVYVQKVSGARFNTLDTLLNSGLEGADALDGAGKPREQTKEDEIKVYRDIILHIPREQTKEDEIEV
jgi:hypothetical protein